MINLLLFYSNLEKTLTLATDEVSAIIIDWEKKGKILRQQSFDTQVNKHDVQDLKDLRAKSLKKVICRVNGGVYIDEREIKTAIDEGANEILLPMVQHPSEVEKALVCIKNQCPLGILVETNQAVKHIEDLVDFPLKRIYFGLNDFAIDNQNSNIFFPLVSRVLERISLACKDIPFGFGGLTYPKSGHPIPCYLLLAEMARLNCDFTFLRRSFYKDLNHYSSLEIYQEIQKEWQHLLKRDTMVTQADYLQLKKYILQQHDKKSVRSHSKILR